MVENIIPFIGGEEEKSEQEPLRLFGKVVDGKIEKATAPLITTQCIRVPVLDGHTAAVFVNFEKKPTKRRNRRPLGKLQKDFHRSLTYQAHQSSSYVIWKKITVHRLN